MSVTAARGALRSAAASLGDGVDRRSPQLRKFLTRGLTVFVYHEITERPSEFQRLSSGFTTPEAFEQQIRWIGDRFQFIAPVDLPQLGGAARLPDDAALVTFDDAWSGVFGVGLPILESLDVPALCFLNMATVEGVPDLAAVRRYERLTRPQRSSRLDDALDASTAAELLADILRRYGPASELRRFQGPTASPEDLLGTSEPGRRIWLASHLLHHWDVDRIAPELFLQSARANAQALSGYPNVLPALATPYGKSIELPLADAAGAEVLFVAQGGQNSRSEGPVLDRLQLEPEPSGPREWWWAVHRRRLFGTLAS